MTALIQLTIQLGLPSALVLFFVWYAQVREQRLSDRLDNLGDEYRKDLVQVIKTSTSTIEQHTHIMVELVEAVRESNRQVSTLLTRMAERPCLIHGENK